MKAYRLDSGSLNLASIRSDAIAQATYAAIETISDADMLLQPRVTWSCTVQQYVVLSFETCTVTVKEKAIKINAG